MPEIATFNPVMEYIYVDSFGEISLEEVQNSIKEVARLSKENNCKKVIIDVKKQVVALQLVDTFTICKNIVAELPENLKIAYIVNNPPKRSQSFFSRLAQTLQQPVEVFHSVDNAMQWFNGSFDPSANPFIGPVQFPSLSK